MSVQSLGLGILGMGARVQLLPHHGSSVHRVVSTFRVEQWKGKENQSARKARDSWATTEILNPMALRTCILRLVGPKAMFYRASGLF